MIILFPIRDEAETRSEPKSDRLDHDSRRTKKLKKIEAIIKTVGLIPATHRENTTLIISLTNKHNMRWLEVKIVH